ncbi:hypothetical protein ACQPYK_00490 [Streptosporangium sp. CA-135522]|uniref:hypothetical protein n=1 Tax=Streptosporangium sp. CA-135522 TaxID=3240072 RepID=UPI003D8F0086
MRIRFLAAAVVTAGAMMATLTGAANASDTPAPVPAPSDRTAVTVVCQGVADQDTVTVRRLTEAEIKDLQAKGGMWEKAKGGVWEKSNESTEPTPTEPGTPSTSSVPAVPAPSLDPSKRAEAGEVRVFSLREGEARLEKGLSDDVRVTEAVPATPTVPASPLDASKPAGEVRVFSSRDGEVHLEKGLSDDVRMAEAVPATAVPGTPLDVIACPLADMKAEAQRSEEAQKSEEAQGPEEAQRSEEAGK